MNAIDRPTRTAPLARHAALVSVILLATACSGGTPEDPGDRPATAGAIEPGIGPASGEAPAPVDPPESGGSPDPAVPPDPAAPPDPDGQQTPDTVRPSEGPIGCAPLDAAQRAAVLERLNAARAQPRSCGGTAFAAAGALVWDTRLEDAARAHSADMAGRNFFSHTGSDGSSASARVSRAGYPWGRTGENIAAGQADEQAALKGWLASEGHCRNLMQPAYRDTALACVANEGSDFGRYWTQVFGTLR